jgi:hypothetical protein
MAHARVSIRQGEGPTSPDNRPYLLIEELQSDLVQHGFDKPVRPDDFWGRQGVLDLYERLRQIPTLSNVSRLEFEKLYSVYRWTPRHKRGPFLDNFFRDRNVPDPEFYPLYEILDETERMIGDPILKGVAAPPITNNREFTRALVESVLAYAQQEGVEEIVFPPFERIVSRRFNVGTPQYEQALQPGSGFHRTYVTALNDVITELQDEFGPNMISVGPRELPYTTATTPQTGSFNRYFDQVVDDYIFDDEVGDFVGDVFSALRGSDVERLQLPETLRMARENLENPEATFFDDASELRRVIRFYGIEDPTREPVRLPHRNFSEMRGVHFGSKALSSVGEYIRRVTNSPTNEGFDPTSIEQQFIDFVLNEYGISPWQYGNSNAFESGLSFRGWLERELDRVPSPAEEVIFVELQRILRKMGTNSLPTEGISINIGNLYNYDLTRPRFFKGGLVTQTRQLFGDLV